MFLSALGVLPAPAGQVAGAGARPCGIDVRTHGLVASRRRLLGSGRAAAAGALASAIAAAAIFVSPALAAGTATVTVRVEGLTETKVPPTQVTTMTFPVIKDGNPEDSCPGTSALGALQLATAGNWSGPWNSEYKQYELYSIEGENHPFESHAEANYYWDFWLNDKESNFGACGVELEPGDRVLFFVACYGAKCPPEQSPLGIEAPASANVGEPVNVIVKQYKSSGESTPAAGASVAGGGASASTDSTGHATLRFTSAGSYLLDVSGSPTGPPAVRTETYICVHNGSDGTCGTSGPSGSGRSFGSSSSSPGSLAAPYTGPYAVVAKVTALLENHRYSHRDAPRILTGKVTAPVAVKQVELRLTRTTGGARGRRRCSYYNGVTERFDAMRCGAEHGRFFSIAAHASFSYLLPFRLPAGRYVLDVEATDLAGSRTTLARGSSRIVFYVG